MPSPPAPPPAADCSACSSNQYRVSDCNTAVGLNRVCRACSLLACDSNEYRQDCGPDSHEGVCVECAGCGANMYRTGCSGVEGGGCTACPSCPAGQYRMGCSGTYEGTCRDCPEGKFASGAGARTSCETCSTCSVGATLATPCTSDADTTCNDVECVSCNSEEYVTGCDKAAGLQGACQACATCGVNQYMSGCGGAEAGACQDCPANMVSPAASTTKSACQCDAGYELESGGACRQCAPGTFSSVGAPSCARCEAGKFNDVVGASTCQTCGVACSIGQEETIACGSNGGTADRACGACDEGTKPINSRHSHANDCSKWVCTDGYIPLQTPNGVHKSRCVLPSPPDTQAVFTVSVEMVLPLTEVQARREEERLALALSGLSDEDPGNIFLLAVTYASEARRSIPPSRPGLSSPAAPGRAPPAQPKVSGNQRDFGRRVGHSGVSSGGSAQSGLGRSGKGGEDGDGESLRSGSSVTMGVRTGEPSRVEHVISLTDLNAELAEVGLPLASRLNSVYSSPGDLSAAPSAGSGQGGGGLAGDPSAGAVDSAADTSNGASGGASANPVHIAIGISGGLGALVCCSLATYLKCKRNRSCARRPVQIPVQIRCEPASRRLSADVVSPAKAQDLRITDQGRGFLEGYERRGGESRGERPGAGHDRKGAT